MKNVHPEAITCDEFWLFKSSINLWGCHIKRSIDGTIIKVELSRNTAQEAYDAAVGQFQAVCGNGLPKLKAPRAPLDKELPLYKKEYDGETPF